MDGGRVWWYQDDRQVRWFDTERERMNMNKDIFWQLMEEAKEQCGKDLGWMVDWLGGHLLGMQPEQILKFYAVLSGYQEAANKYGLWTAAELLKENGCSDERFLYFRNWLIAQGKEVYLAALKDPDSLADVRRYDNCEFVSLNYVGYKAYQELTGRDIYPDCTSEMRNGMLEEVSQEIPCHPLIEYPLEIPDALTVYPRLGAIYAKRYDFEDLRKDSMWNTSLPEIRELVGQGAEKVRKLRTKQQKNIDKKKKRERPSRSLCI